MITESGALITVRAMKTSGRLPHAFLFVGERGVGKRELAKYAAKLILCEHEACGTCRHCKRIDANAHPDVLYPERTGKTLIYSKDTLRGVCSDAIVRPNDCDAKVYVFLDCEHISDEAQNVILKLIEEPPDNVYFIFTAISRGIFLPTILSRVITVTVNGETPIEYIDEEIISLARKIADGIALGDEYEVLSSLAQIGENREKIREVIVLVAQIVRDACAVRLNAEMDGGGGIRLTDYYPDGASKMARGLSFGRACRINDAVHDALGYLKSNVNPSAVMSALGGILAV